MSHKKIERLAAADAQAGGQRRPFAKAVRAGDFVYVSGQVPTVALMQRHQTLQGLIVGSRSHQRDMVRALDAPPH